MTGFIKARIISAVCAGVILTALAAPASCQSGDWEHLSYTPTGSSHASWEEKLGGIICSPQERNISGLGATAYMHGCPGYSEVSLAGTVVRRLKWKGVGQPPSVCTFRVITHCSWSTHNGEVGEPVIPTYAHVTNTWGDRLLPLGGTGNTGEQLYGERIVNLPVDADGIVTVTASFSAEARISGLATSSGDISVGAAITSVQPCTGCTLSPSVPPIAPHRTSSMPSYPIRPDHNPINGGAKSGGDPVNLASGKHEYLPAADITVYNPYGPRVSYIRNFEAVRADSGYCTPGLSCGWVDTYDVKLAVVSGTATWRPLDITYPNGATERITPVTEGDPAIPTGSFTNGVVGAPYFVEGQAGASGQWNWIKITWKDRTAWTFTPTTDAAVYRLTKISNGMGSSINILRDAGNQYRVTSVTDDRTPANTLLTFTYNGSQLASLTDRYGRRVVYTFGMEGSIPCLTAVSQIGSGMGTPPARHAYGYELLGSPQQAHLHSVSFPNPSGSGMSQQIVNHDQATGKVSSLVDANGRVTEFSYEYSNGTRVKVKRDAQAAIPEQEWVENFDPTKGCISTGRTDADGSCVYITYADTANPTKPTKIRDRNGKITSISYDQYGNTLTITTPRNVVTTYSYDTVFPLGRLASAQVTGKPATTFAYVSDSPALPTSGLISSITGPKPGGSGTVTTSFTYDSLGNVLTKTVPAASDTGTITITYDYGAEPKLGQPLMVSDGVTHTHIQYDDRGNVTSSTDALDHVTNYTYNIADQPVSVTYPAE